MKAYQAAREFILGRAADPDRMVVEEYVASLKLGLPTAEEEAYVEEVMGWIEAVEIQVSWR